MIDTMNSKQCCFACYSVSKRFVDLNKQVRSIKQRFKHEMSEMILGLDRDDPNIEAVLRRLRDNMRYLNRD